MLGFSLPILIHVLIQNHSLRRIFLLLNGKHTIHETDLAMLRSLDERMQDPSDVKSGNRTCTLQAVVTKLDTFAKSSSAADIKAIRNQIFEAAPTCLPPIFTSTTMKPMVGVIALRKAIAEACGLPEPTSEGY
jgi:GTP-binding protein